MYQAFNKAKSRKSLDFQLASGLTALALIGALPVQAFPLLTAQGSITLPNGTRNYVDSNDNNPVNIWGFPFDSASNSSGFIHSYSSVDGDFGSRASGQGFFNVNSFATFADRITNTGPSTANAVLNYSLNAGEALVSGLGSSSAQVIITVKNGATVVGAANVVIATTNGIVSASGVTSTLPGFTAPAFNGGGSIGYLIPSQSGSINLGALTPGFSFDYSYTIQTIAIGTLDPGSYVQRTVQQCADYGPYREVTIPGGYGYGYGYGGGSRTIIEPAGQRCVDTVILVPSGQNSNNYALARSGDPLNATLGNGDTNGDTYFNFTSFVPGTNVSTQLSPVPAPSTLALVAAGLGLAQTARRRKP
jgi:hypothetical protein